MKFIVCFGTDCLFSKIGLCTRRFCEFLFFYMYRCQGSSANPVVGEFESCEKVWLWFWSPDGGAWTGLDCEGLNPAKY